MTKTDILSRTGFTCVFCDEVFNELHEHGMQIQLHSTWNTEGLSGYICASCTGKKPFSEVGILLNDKLKVDKLKVKEVK